MEPGALELQATALIQPTTSAIASGSTRDDDQRPSMPPPQPSQPSEPKQQDPKPEEKPSVFPPVLATQPSQPTDSNTQPQFWVFPGPEPEKHVGFDQPGQCLPAISTVSPQRHEPYASCIRGIPSWSTGGLSSRQERCAMPEEPLCSATWMITIISAAPSLVVLRPDAPTEAFAVLHYATTAISAVIYAAVAMNENDMVYQPDRPLSQAKPKHGALGCRPELNLFFSLQKRGLFAGEHLGPPELNYILQVSRGGITAACGAHCAAAATLNCQMERLVKKTFRKRNGRRRGGR